MTDLHFIITVQWTDGVGHLNNSTMSGIVRRDGRTRDQLYTWVFDQVTTRYGAPPARTSVLFFSVEPNVPAVSLA